MIAIDRVYLSIYLSIDMIIHSGLIQNTFFITSEILSDTMFHDDDDVFLSKMYENSLP